MKLKPWGWSDLVASFQQLKFIEIGTGTGLDHHDGHGDGMDGKEAPQLHGDKMVAFQMQLHFGPGDLALSTLSIAGLLQELG